MKKDWKWSVTWLCARGWLILFVWHQFRYKKWM